MLVFDKQRKGCVSPPTADCDVPPPPPPEEGEEGEGGFDEEGGEPRGRGRPRARPANRRRFQQEERFQDEGPLPDNRGPLPDNRDFIERPDGRGNARPLPADFDLPDGALPLNLN